MLSCVSLVCTSVPGTPVETALLVKVRCACADMGMHLYIFCLKRKDVFVCVCAHVRTHTCHICEYLQWPEEGARSCGAGVAGSGEPPDVRADSRSTVPWKSSWHSYHWAASPVPTLKYPIGVKTELAQGPTWCYSVNDFWKRYYLVDS